MVVLGGVDVSGRIGFRVCRTGLDWLHGARMVFMFRWQILIFLTLFLFICVALRVLGVWVAFLLHFLR